MENLITQGKEILEDVNAVNYEEMVDRANDWLKEIETELPDPSAVEEIYEIASRVFKPTLQNVNPFFAPPVVPTIEEKVDFFREKLEEILEVLQKNNPR
ncbi:MAG: hypothetical protein GX095_00640 [Clostridiales bacterium]|nr:hypothetical protein [Clostridiales bacterium]